MSFYHCRKWKISFYDVKWIVYFKSYKTFDIETSKKWRNTPDNGFIDCNDNAKQQYVTSWKRLYNFDTLKKGKRKVQRVPQSQTAVLPRPQEEEETDKSKQAQIEQTYKKH